MFTGFPVLDFFIGFFAALLVMVIFGANVTGGQAFTVAMFSGAMSTFAKEIE